MTPKSNILVRLIKGREVHELSSLSARNLSTEMMNYFLKNELAYICNKNDYHGHAYYNLLSEKEFGIEARILIPDELTVRLVYDALKESGFSKMNIK